ncbi:menaquinone biosynthesis prenyltransferase MqnP [Streptomyces iconiensis]|uniref:Menaquinone biosynthesis prenyltransferase MqnP n=1 Tax=Streptomyces iconiensis TaxID=1384038 RepID=A0ABT6ZXM6_9ACTN|nr:menaquinone biosynthesis prenyltransferase MqnP [Streptomyces iconiensis]MDJ1133817.1 menaquinone biosynthesis prenyltransferase MqnP [Streptomyces iconiensis]
MTSAAEGVVGPGPGPGADAGRVRAFLRLVVIEHSVFALPFAYTATLTAMFRDSRSTHWWQLFLVTVAMVGMRTFAMAANRIIDREIDARNPRTATRELVTGAVSVRTAWTGAVVAVVVFLGACALLNPLCLALAPVAVIPMVVYPYGKRFTHFPHAILGLAQAIGPVGAWLAVTGTWSWEAAVLGLAVGIWIGGFDLIYACQDVEADRANGVKSTPARFGTAAAIHATRGAHLVTVALLAVFGAMTSAGVLYWFGLVIVAVAFVYEHRVVRPHDLTRLNRAFFQVNSFIGIAFFVCALLDLAVRGLAL